MLDEYSLFMTGNSGDFCPIGTVSISLDLATAIAGYKAFQHDRRICVFEGSLIRRIVDPPDKDFLVDLTAQSTQYGFEMRIRGVKAKGMFGPYTYSPWVEAASFNSGRDAVDAFQARRLKRTEEFQIVWCGAPVVSVGRLLSDVEARRSGGACNPRLEMLVRSFGSEAQERYRIAKRLGGTPVFPRGKNLFAQGPRICPNALCLLPDDLEDRLYTPT